MNAIPQCNLYRIYQIFLLALLATSLCSCAMVHHYDDFTGKIVDAETGAPIEGVAVVATYYTVVYTPAGKNGWYLMTQEALTDKEGKFVIPTKTAWTFRPLSTFDPKIHFTIFKPSYDCYTSYSEILLQRAPAGQEVVISLLKLKTFKERMDSLSCTPSVSVPMADYPNLRRLLDEERIYLGLEPINISK